MNRFGVNDLIRLFFLQKEQQLFERSNLNIPGDFSSYAFEKWFQQFHGFSLDYQAYYFDKYENKETKQQPINKFMRQVQSVSVLKNNFIFIKWFEEAVDSTNTFFKEKNKWSDNIFYNPEGEYSFNFSRFALQFSLLKQSLYNKTNQLINN